MLTYQDLVNVGENESNRMDFVMNIIHQHKASDDYKIGAIAEEYYKKRNVTLVKFQKMLTTLTGGRVVDKWSPNHKVVSGFFKRFVTQQNQYSLGNGISWGENPFADDKQKARFDSEVKQAGLYALIGGVSFGFWNLDHLDVFKITEFAPLYDEENGALRAGVRFWQIDADKPLRATLYEEDGYTEYRWKDGKGEILQDKRKYIITVSQSDIDGTEIIDGENYPTFPIVPLWGNPEKQSELVGIREGIDVYDFIKNGFANDLDGAQLYWIIKGAGGMDDPDLAQFLDRLRLVGAASPAEGQSVEAVTLDLPYDARDNLLTRLENDLYRDYMSLNLADIKSGSVVTAQIKAAYKPMDLKADDYEYMLGDFLDHILTLAGIDATPTFTRSMLVNTTEEITAVLSAANMLPKDYVVQKIVTLLGDGDRAQEIAEQAEADGLFLNNEETEVE
jgi:hypothetical protein